MTGTKACLGCGALVPDIDGPVHKYVPSSPGCWKTFGEVQVDEAQRFRYTLFAVAAAHGRVAQRESTTLTS